MMEVRLMLNIFKILATQFYQENFYDKAVIKSFVLCGALNADDYKEITGDDYVAPSAK